MSTEPEPERHEQRDIPLPSLPGGNTRPGGQATSIEQTRAAAQVYAMVVAAHERRRTTSVAVDEMLDACRRTALAERAFYSYRRSGETISGPTVQLARELARCWGNIEAGLVELSRDDQLGESELLAFAWDLQGNTRSSHTFIVKHLRDTKQGVRKLTDQRDIYENNANNGARRVREAIFAVLPGWYVEQAVEQCNTTIKEGGGVPLQRRIALAIDGYAGIKVTREQLERHVGASSNDWTAHDVARLGVTFRSIDRGETTLAEQFPPPEERVTADEITGGKRGRASRKASTTEPPATEQPATETSTPTVDPEPDPRDEDDQLPAPGTRAWHDTGHPTQTLDGVQRQDEVLNGDCGFCEQAGGDS